MKILEIFVALLFVNFSLIRCQECNTSIVRDIVNPDDIKRIDFFINLGGSIVPLLNGSEALGLRHLGSSNVFNILFFKLSNSEPYYITAIDLQFGDVGSCQGTGDVIEIDKIRIGTSITENGNSYVPATYGDSDGYLNLTELGDPNNGRIIRLKIPVTRGHIVVYRIITTSPAGSNAEQIRLCLRTEIYGCLVSSVTTAPTTVRDLLQYNLVEPTIYSDSKYTGVVSQGYLSGGQGILNDGIIGRNPSTPDTNIWLGWLNPDVSNSEILFLFAARRFIHNISIFYLANDGILNGVEFYEDDGLVSGFSETTESDGFVNRGIYSHSRFATGYLRVNLIGTNPVAITEIEIIRFDGTNLLGPVLDTSRFTVPNPMTPTQTTNIAATTQTSESTSATNHQTSPIATTIPITTQRPILTTQSTYTSTTQTINTTNDTATQYTTMPPICLIPEQISSLPVIIGISLALFLSICLNIALVLLLLVCYSRYYRTAVRMRREERDQGDYVPMAPVETKNYENVSSKSGIKESVTQQQKGDTKDQHYYSKIGSEYVATT